MNDEILVKVEDLRESSKSKLTKVCDNEICGKHIPNQTYQNIIKYRINGKDYCFNCAHKNRGKFKRENVKYEKSLEYYALNNDKQYLLSEFSTKNSKTPDKISKGTNDIYLWNCSNCKSEYDMSVGKRTIEKGNQNCPYCSGKRINETNYLWTTHPEVAKLLKNPQRGYEVTYGSHKKEEFVCKECKHVNIKNIHQIAVQGFSCERCSDGVSYPEKLMIQILDQIGIQYLNHHRFEWSNNKEYDFYIPSLNCIIETHGIQHYSESFINMQARSLEEEQENDRLKERLAIDNCILNYIIIDCRESDLDYIKNNMIKQLSCYFNLENIDWDKCNEFAVKTFIKTASVLWNSGVKNTSQIGKIINVHRKTVNTYLKKAHEIGWCVYIPSEIKKEILLSNKKKNMRKIIQISLYNGTFIKEWDSIANASRDVNLTSVSSISAVCKGQRKTSGGFFWMYKEDYEKMINNQSTVI